MANRAERIGKVLTTHFNPTHLEIVDESARHAGHMGARPEGETHFNVALVSGAFQGESRVARSRRVHAALESEFARGLHALSLTLRTPEEEQVFRTREATPANIQRDEGQ